MTYLRQISMLQEKIVVGIKMSKSQKLQTKLL